MDTVYSVKELLLAKAETDKYRFIRTLSYSTQADVDCLLFEEGKVEWQKRHLESGGTVVLSVDDGILDIRIVRGWFEAVVYAIDDETAESLIELIKTKVPQSELKEDEIDATFWRLGQHGPVATVRKIACPTWADTERNYASSTSKALGELMRAELSLVRGGKLVLWHGEPGTGKTFALRSWARTCKDLIDIHYIVDPEVFFGESAAYMFDVLLGEDDSNKWRLIVAEDTGELLTKDAKRNTGQALSRLLNVCDGLIGQGLRVLVLITTNEELGTLHPAVTRAGRCLANIAFKKLDEKETVDWLQDKEYKKKWVALGNNTIAELYSKLEGGEQITAQEKSKVMGFAT